MELLFIPLYSPRLKPIEAEFSLEIRNDRCIGRIAAAFITQ